MAYADYGVGKTYLMGTSADIPSMNDVLMVSAEGGDMTYENDPDHAFNKIDILRVKDFKATSRAYEYMKAHAALRDRDPNELIVIGREKQKQGDKEVEVPIKVRIGDRLMQLQQAVAGDSFKDPTRVRRYRTVILDSLTEIETYCMAQLLGMTTDQVKLDEETQSAEWAEYKKQHMMVQRLVRAFRDLPMHVLITCARDLRQDESKKEKYFPMMTGKLRSQVQGFLDMVGYLVVGNPGDDENAGPAPRRLYVQPGPKFAAKIRTSKFRGRFFDDPTIGGILHAMGILEDADVPLRWRFKPKETPAKQA